MNKYAVMLFNKRDNTHTVEAIDLTKAEADKEVTRLRDDKLPAFWIAHTDYKKMFGTNPKCDDE